MSTTNIIKFTDTSAIPLRLCLGDIVHAGDPFSQQSPMTIFVLIATSGIVLVDFNLCLQIHLLAIGCEMHLY